MSKLQTRYDNTDGRLRGRALQAARLRIWSKHPYCAKCCKLVTLNYPDMNGFELDHKTMVSKDGSNDDDNLQILCSGNNGCHAKKTAKDMGWRKQGGCDVNGNPLNADHRWTAGIPPPPRQSSRG